MTNKRFQPKPPVDYFHEDKDNCSRCDDFIPDNWESKARSIKMDIHDDCLASEHLWGKEDAKDIHFDHPALITDKCTEQIVKIQTGSHPHKYSLCRKCHHEFMRLIGDFLKENDKPPKQATFSF